MDVGAILIKINPALTDIRLADVLDAIVKVARQPIKYSIEDYAIVFSRKGHETTPLYVRTFKVDPNTLLNNLHLAKGPVQAPPRPDDSPPPGGPNFVRGPVGTNWPAPVAKALRDYFAKAGVDLDPARSPGKAVFYDDRQGLLLVRATMQDLDIIEAAIQMLNVVPPQVNIKSKFVEVSQDDTKALGFDWYLGNVLMTNGAIGGQAGTASALGTNDLLLPSGLPPGVVRPLPPPLTGILTDPQFRMVIKALQQRSGTELLAAARGHYHQRPPGADEDGDHPTRDNGN